jgi:non-canonical purine NTP pyrophosphatase (RdgB/HAM1 family)
MKKLTFITGNTHKAEQYERLLDVPMVHQKIDLDEIQSVDFTEVARHKINQAYEAVQCPVIIDDFGFCLEGLDDLPGPFTKFFVQSEDSLEKLCRIADTLASRRAKIVGVIAYKDADRTEIFVRELQGQVSQHPRGAQGIATDFIFEPDGYDGKTRAELDIDLYDEVYCKVRPFSEVRQFLESIIQRKDRAIV